MNTGRLNSDQIWALPLWAALLPLVTINASYLVAVSLQHIPACIPYISGCTSTSSAGRLAPESLLFRTGMLTEAVIVLLFWQQCSTFLSLGVQPHRRHVSMRLLGIAAALSLALYTVTLGLPGNEYRLLRRIGIDGFFLGNYGAQILLVFFYRRMAVRASTRVWRWLVAICVALPAAAIIGEVAKWAGAAKHPVNNVVEWNALVLLSLYFGAVAWLWRHHGFAIEYRLGGQGRSDRRP